RLATPQFWFVPWAIATTSWRCGRSDSAVRLDPAEVPGLPLPCALLDRDGQALAATPEWAGAGPGAAVFLVGQGPLVVAPEVTTLAVNAHQHEGASRVRLRVDRGPSFYVEWPSSAPRTVRVESHRHSSRRGGWGWGYVQMVADALGATALPPGPCGPGAV